MFIEMAESNPGQKHKKRQKQRPVSEPGPVRPPRHKKLSMRMLSSSFNRAVTEQTLDGSELLRSVYKIPGKILLQCSHFALNS